MARSSNFDFPIKYMHYIISIPGSESHLTVKIQSSADGRRGGKKGEFAEDIIILSVLVTAVVFADIVAVVMHSGAFFRSTLYPLVADYTLKRLI